MQIPQILQMIKEEIIGSGGSLLIGLLFSENDLHKYSVFALKILSVNMKMTVPKSQFVATVMQYWENISYILGD